jgi:hypothetical protein
MVLAKCHVWKQLITGYEWVFTKRNQYCVLIFESYVWNNAMKTVKLIY